MSKVNYNLKLHFIQTLDRVLEPGFASTTLFGNKARHQDSWQVLWSACHLSQEQKVKAQLKIEAGVKS